MTSKTSSLAWFVRRRGSFRFADREPGNSKAWNAGSLNTKETWDGQLDFHRLHAGPDDTVQG